MDSAVYDELAAVEDTHWWFLGRRRIMRDVLRRRLGRGGTGRSIVDVGCGTGGMLGMLREFGTVTGLDASPIAVHYCEGRFGASVEVRLGRIPEDIPEGADLITAFDVVEHLEDDEKALAGIRDRLPAGGLFVCTVPAFPFLWSGHDVVHHHYRRYTGTASAVASRAPGSRSSGSATSTRSSFLRPPPSGSSTGSSPGRQRDRTPPPLNRW